MPVNPEWLSRILEYEPKSEQSYRAAAHHEAGHAVLAIALGLRLTQSGKIIIDVNPNTDIWLHRGFPEICAIVLYAGYYSAKLFEPNREPVGCIGNRINPYIAGDFERARECCPADDDYHEELKKLTQTAVNRRWSVISDVACELLDKGVLDKEYAEEFIKRKLTALAWPILPSLTQIALGEEPGPWYWLAV